MTGALFYDNVYLKEFTANILNVLKIDDSYHIVLDQTAFYPQGGGQPSDVGSIDNCSIHYVYKKDNKIYHVSHQKPSNHLQVQCLINWDIRFDHMQQHLGQHILSACFYELFDANTVGFHLGKEYVTIDVTLDTISPSQIEQVEYFSNQVIFNNFHVHQLYPTKEQLNSFALRKSPSVSKNIRIIQIDGLDYCPCGGTHPTHTGEVGLIKIRKYEKYKQSTRIEFVCGNRALKDYVYKNNQINAISHLLSVKDHDALSGVKKILSSYTQQKKELKQLKQNLLKKEADDLYESAILCQGVKIICKVYEGKSFDALKVLASQIVSHTKSIALLGTKNEKGQCILSCSKDISISMNEIFKQISPVLNGKGGGNQHLAQGGTKYLTTIDTALSKAYHIILEEL